MNAAVNALPILCGLFIVVCAYSAQYWAKKCYDELKAIREDLSRANSGK